MNRETLVEGIVHRSGLNREEVRGVLEHFLELVSEELEAGGRVELRGFGTFSTRRRAARPARNPRSGEAVWLEERLVAAFRPAARLKERISKAEKP